MQLGTSHAPTCREDPSTAIEEQTMSRAENRVEHDLLGDRQVPADAYYGIHTLRARENFPITGIAISTYPDPVSYTHLRAHETDSYLVCRLLLEKKQHQ